MTKEDRIIGIGGGAFFVIAPIMYNLIGPPYNFILLALLFAVAFWGISPLFAQKIGVIRQIPRFRRDKMFANIAMGLGIAIFCVAAVWRVAIAGSDPADKNEPRPTQGVSQDGTGNVHSTGQSGGQNIGTQNNYYGSGPQSNGPEMDAAHKAASPEIKALMADKEIFRPIYRQYIDEKLGGVRPTNVEVLKTPEAVNYYNDHLATQGSKLRVTRKNIDKLFGSIIERVNITNFHSKGVVLDNSNGNTFGKLNISGVGEALTLKNAHNNSFDETNINQSPKATTKTPE